MMAILIVDDHPLFVEALKLVIHGAFPQASVSEATSIDSARTILDKGDPFDLVLLDLSMPGTRGLDGLIELRSRHPKLPIVVVSALEDARIIHEVMTCGAAGFISKSTRGSDLGLAIQSVMDGVVVLPERLPAAAPRCAGRRHLRPDRAAGDAHAATGARAADAAPGSAQQADRFRPRCGRDDGQGARLGDPAQAARFLAHAGGDRGFQDRFQFRSSRTLRAGQAANAQSPSAAAERPHEVVHQRAQLGRLHRLQEQLAAEPARRVGDGRRCGPP